MGKQKLHNRLLASVICIAMAVQVGFVMPAFAASTYTYQLNYNELETLYGEDGDTELPIIIIPGDSAEVHRSYPGSSQTTGSVISDWDSVKAAAGEPYRILDHTFDGWYIINDSNNRTEVTSSTVITDSILAKNALHAASRLEINGKWTRYGSPYIENVSFTKKNANDEYISDEIVWKDAISGSSNTINLSEDRTRQDYYTIVYGNMDSLHMSFRQYEPSASVKVYLNGTELDTDETDITSNDAYHIVVDPNDPNDAGTLQKIDGSVKTGADIEVTEDIKLRYTGSSGLTAGYNDIKVIVTMPDSSTYEYNFYVKRLARELHLNYGNTPYGAIMQGASSSDTPAVIDRNRADGEEIPVTAEDTAKASFVSSHRYNGASYIENAWNFGGSKTTSVKKRGIDLDSDEYINYDEDDSAIVAFLGREFTDPGITIYDEAAKISPDSAHKVTRTIKYQTVKSLKPEDWGPDVTDETHVTELKGDTDENVLHFLETDYVKPGVYEIEYSYTPSSGDVSNASGTLTATRRLIVLPRYQMRLPTRYDINMDNYINALDTIVYDKAIAATSDSGFSSLSEYLYRYRVLDVAPGGEGNGTIDSVDKNYFKNLNSMLWLYANGESASDAAVQEAPASYNTPLSPSSDKTQLYMDFLGGTHTDLPDGATLDSYITGLSSKPEDASELQQGDTFFIGYRFDNAVNFDTEKDMKVITLSVNYDSRYVRPLASTASALETFIKMYNPALADKFTLVSNISESYIVDKTTAAQTWNKDDNVAQVKTLKMEIYLNDDANVKLTDGYFLKLPFRVVNIPIIDVVDHVEYTRKALSTELGANTFNMAFGDTGYMWDTGKTINNVTENLMDKLEYMGDCTLNFGEDTTEAIVLDAGVYGEDYNQGNLPRNPTIEGDFPPGLQYNAASGRIHSKPTEAREDNPYIFYINGTKYSLEIKKATMYVKAKDTSKTYGEENPLSYAFDYDTSCLKFETDTVSGTGNIVKTTPQFICDATATSDVGEYDIILDPDNPGDADNYKFVDKSEVEGEETAKLTINPKAITITPSTVYIPDYSIAAPYRGEVSYTDLKQKNIETTSGSTTIPALEISGLVGDDTIEITYDVAYKYYKKADGETTPPSPYESYPEPTVSGNGGTDNDRDVLVTLKSIDDGNYVFDSSASGAVTDADGKVTVVFNSLGTIKNDAIKGFEINVVGDHEYYYGDSLDLNQGLVEITYESTENTGLTPTYTLNEALGTTLNIKYLEDGVAGISSLKDARDGDYLSVADNNKKLYVYDTYNNPNGTGGRTITIHVYKKELHVTPDDKTRYYGEDNNHLYTYDTTKTNNGKVVYPKGLNMGYTYTIDEDDLPTDPAFDAADVNDNTESEVRALLDAALADGKFAYVCDADEDTEIEGENTTREISVSSDDPENILDNYTITFGTATLTIDKRPIKVTINTDTIPALSAKYYNGFVSQPYFVPTLPDDGGEEEPNAAYAGTDSPSMTIGTLNDGLYSNDQIKVTYYAKYDKANNGGNYVIDDLEHNQNQIDETQDIAVYLYDLKLAEDENYPKNKNYVLANEDPTDRLTSGGKIRKKKISKIEIGDKDSEVETEADAANSKDGKIVIYEDKQLRTTYTYDDNDQLDLKLAEGETAYQHPSETTKNIHITYDDGAAEDISFYDAELSTRTDFNVRYVDKDNNIYDTYGPKLVVADETDKKLKIQLVYTDDLESEYFTAGDVIWEKPLTVAKHELHVSSDNFYTLYGSSDSYYDSTQNKYKFSYTYRESDFQYDDADGVTTANLSSYANNDRLGQAGKLGTSYVPPTLAVYEDNGERTASKTTPANVYDILISGASADNYEFVYTEGELAIRQRPIVIEEIKNIPALSAEEAKKGISTNSSLTGEITSDETDKISFASGAAPINDGDINDVIKLRYTITYPDLTAIGTTPVDVTALIIDDENHTGKNYYLQRVMQQYGSIKEKKISGLEITQNPLTFDPVYGEKKYLYGDELELDEFRFTIKYDDAETEITDVTFDELTGKYGFKAVLAGKTTPNPELTKELAEFLHIEDGGQNIRFIPPEADSTEAFYYGGDGGTDTREYIRVLPRPLSIKVQSSSYTYGSTPTADIFEVEYEGFAAGEDESDLQLDGVPKFNVTLEDGTVIFEDSVFKTESRRTDAGIYEGVITVSEAAPFTDGYTNYTFIDTEAVNQPVLVKQTGDLTIKPRKISITGITGGIPTLTAEIIRNVIELGQDMPELPATAELGYNDTEHPDMVTAEAPTDTTGLVDGDNLLFSYKIKYENTSGDDADVTYFDLDTSEESKTATRNANYMVDSYPVNLQGEVQARKVTYINVDEDPDNTADGMVYTYGDGFMLRGGKVNLKYNNTADVKAPFEGLDALDVVIEFVKQGDVPADDTVLGKVVQNALLTVTDHNGAKIRLTAPDPDDDIQPARQVYTIGGLTVNKRDMRVTADSVRRTYGDTDVFVPDNHYTAADLVNGDSFSDLSASSRFNVTKPHSYIITDKDGRHVMIDRETPVGTYTIIPVIDPEDVHDTDNYNLVPVAGTITIEPKELNVLSIKNIPRLTSKMIYETGGATPIIIEETEASNTRAEFTSNDIEAGDKLGIIFDTVYYSTDSLDEDGTVGIENVKLSEDLTEYPDNANYKLVFAPPTAKGGAIEQAQISEVIINVDPTLLNDSDRPMQYTYGDVLNLNRGSVDVIYDSGYSIRNLKFSELYEKTDHKLTLSYIDAEGNVMSDKLDYEDASKNVLYVSRHNGARIRINIDTKAENVTEPMTAPLTVNKAVITAKADHKEKIYGDPNPLLTITYTGFVNGDNRSSANFRQGLTEPSISCDAAVKSPITEEDKGVVYPIVLEGGESTNYRFVLENDTLTINKRTLDVLAITGGVPALSSKIIFDEQPETDHKVDGYAINTAGHLQLDNLSYGDEIRLTYVATYNGNEAGENVTVYLSDIKIDEDYGDRRDGHNYELGSLPVSSDYGVIYAKQLTNIEIVSQPKLEYTYGERLDLSEKGVRLSYDDGSVISNVAYSDLGSYFVDLVLTDNEGTKTYAKTGDKLTVPLHDGAHMTLIPTENATNLQGISSVDTESLTVNKKPLNIIVASASSTYGDDPTKDFAFSYNADDFVVNDDYEQVYDDSEEALKLNGLLNDPADFVCNDGDGTPVSVTTPVGNYTISMVADDGTYAANYKVVINPGNLRITPRKLVIDEITGGVPDLTSDVIYNKPEEYYNESRGIFILPASATNSQLKFKEGTLANNDLISIKYNAIYNKSTEDNSYTVDIEYISMNTDGYPRSYNYEIDTANSVQSAGGGVIHDREITEISIKEQPTLVFTYGDKLNLEEAGGVVHIVYDSGYEEDVPFAALTDPVHRIAMTYTLDNDSSYSQPVLDGSPVTVPAQNGKKITLMVTRSTHSVAPKTINEAIKVDKLRLIYDVCDVDNITYDGSTKVTTGTINFANKQNGDKVTASGTFTFEDAEAGTNKMVYITDISLNRPFTDNYFLPSTEMTAKGTIDKDTPEAILDDASVELSAVTNAITVTPPAMTQTQIDGGAKYEYSIDGGETWQDSNVFENLDFGQQCSVCIRYAETDNYSESAWSAPVDVTTYKARLTLTSRDTPTDGGDYQILYSLYTNKSSIENEAELREFIGETEEEYFTLYSALEENTAVEYPINLTGDVNIYTTLKRPTNNNNTSNGGNGGGGSGGGQSTVRTPQPTEDPETTPSPTADPDASPAPTTDSSHGSGKKNIPYLSGFEGKIHPDDYMTRAEAATIMVMLSGETGEEYENIFPDVREDTWYIGYIAEASARGLISGFEDGNFYPENTVTREQFAAMVVRMIGLEPTDGQKFDDVDEWRWSAGSINAATDAGIITGYDDGTFLPEAPTRRSEAVRMINVATGRIPDEKLIDTLTCPYSDLPASHWAYYEFMIAACEFDIPE